MFLLKGEVYRTEMLSPGGELFENGPHPTRRLLSSSQKEHQLQLRVRSFEFERLQIDDQLRAQEAALREQASVLTGWPGGRGLKRGLRGRRSGSSRRRRRRCGAWRRRCSPAAKAKAAGRVGRRCQSTARPPPPDPQVATLQLDLDKCWEQKEALMGREARRNDEERQKHAVQVWDPSAPRAALVADAMPRPGFVNGGTAAITVVKEDQ